MIIKVQVAQFGSAPMCLIYDKRRKYEFHGPMSEDLKLIMGDRPKAFFLAEVDDQKRFNIGEEVPWQTW